MRDLHSEYSRGMNVYLPSEKDLEIFLRLVEKDLSLVKIVVALALSYTYPSARGD
jgi:CRISPR type I-A-associated protein Csa5